MKRSLNKLLFFIICAGFFILPLVLFPSPSQEVTRVFFLNRWVELLLLISLILFFITKKKLKFSIFFAFLLVFFLIAFLTSIFGFDFRKSFWGNYFRADGLFTYLHLLILLLIFSVFWENSWKKNLIYSINLGSILASLLFLANKVIGNKLGLSSFSQPILLSGYLLVTFPFLFYLFKKQNQKIYRVVLALLMFIQVTAICLTGALGGIIGLSIFFLITVLELHKKNKKIILAGIGIFLSLIIMYVVATRIKNKSNFVAESRERIFTKLILGWTKKPLLGYGWANVDYAFEAVDWPMRFSKDVYVDKAHSMILEVLVTTGILGLITYLLLLVISFKRLIKKLKKEKRDKFWVKTLIMIFLLYVFHSQTNVISIAEEAVFWFILGLAAV